MKYLALSSTFRLYDLGYCKDSEQAHEVAKELDVDHPTTITTINEWESLAREVLNIDYSNKEAK